MSRTSMITRIPAHRQAQLDAAVEPTAERAAHPGLGYEAAPRPETRVTATRAYGGERGLR